MILHGAQMYGRLAITRKQQQLVPFGIPIVHVDWSLIDTASITVEPFIRRKNYSSDTHCIQYN